MIPVGTYMEIYRHLIYECRLDVDEAQCFMSDLEDALENDTEGLDVWDYFDQLIG